MLVVSAPLLGVTASGGICINICHFVTSGTMLRNFQQPGQTAVIIKNLQILQQWLDGDNRIQREEVEECKRKISDLFQIANFVVALSLFFRLFSLKFY